MLQPVSRADWLPAFVCLLTVIVSSAVTSNFLASYFVCASYFSVMSPHRETQEIILQ